MLWTWGQVNPFSEPLKKDQDEIAPVAEMACELHVTC